MLRNISLFIQLNYIRHLGIKLWQVIYLAGFVWVLNLGFWSQWNLRFVEAFFPDMYLDLADNNKQLILILLAIYLVLVFNLLTIVNDVFVDLVIAVSHFIAFNLIGYIYLFSDFGIWPFLEVNLLFLVDLLFLLAGRLHLEESKNEIMTKMFSRYVNKDLLANLMANPKQMDSLGRLQKVSIMFSDLRGFTTISEKTNPQVLIQILNTYLQEMSGVLVANNATIDKFIGDAIMCFWNAPIPQANHQTTAVDACVEMLINLSHLKKRGKQFEQLNMGIGLHSGDVIVGNIGSDRKADYTIIGDNVNLTSRLEGLTKNYGIHLIVTEAIVNAYQSKVSKFDLIFRYIDSVKVRGKSEYIKVYQPLIRSPHWQSVKEQYEKGMQYYTNKNYSMALDSFGSIILNQDIPAQVMIHKIHQKMPKQNSNTSWRLSR
jgi:adenylate cyclase